MWITKELSCYSSKVGNLLNGLPVSNQDGWWNRIYFIMLFCLLFNIPANNDGHVKTVS